MTKTNQSQPNKTQPSASWFERLTWTLGVALLASYGGARLWLDHSTERAVDSFKQFSNAQRDTRVPRSALPGNSVLSSPGLAQEAILKVPAPDMKEWSVGRKRAFDQLAVRDSNLPLAILSIDALGLEVPVYGGTEEWNLNRGAGWIEGTSPIGAGGNVGVAAHRDGYFRALEDVELGQTLMLETVTRRIAYRVTGIRIVKPDAVEVLASTERDTITLVTCYPFYYVGPAPQRFIVSAERIRPRAVTATISATGS